VYELDQDALDRNTPLVTDLRKDIINLKRNRLAFNDDRLHGAGANNESESRLSTLDECLAEVSDAECGAIRIFPSTDRLKSAELLFSITCKLTCNLEIADRVDIDIDVVARNDGLTA
jgi:hypothetical protein